MTIEEARQLSPADLEYTEGHVQRARDEAGKAYEHAARLSDRAIEGGPKAPTAAEVLSAHADADHLRQRAERVTVKAAAAAEARRLLELDKLRDDIDAFAAKAAGDTGISAAADAVIAAHDKFRKACADHNTELDGLRQRATGLGAEKLPMSGELSAASAYVHHSVGGLRTASVHVHPIGRGMTDRAIELLGEGKKNTALRAVGPVAEIYPVQEGQ